MEGRSQALPRPVERHPASEREPLGTTVRRFARAAAESRVLIVLVLAALVALSMYERSRAIYASYWIDEGISIGISRHSLVDIPGVLRQDGSPPLYYMILHVWTELFGTREVITHRLSLLFTLLTIPAAYWAAAAWSRAAGLAAAVVVAFSPFLDIHAMETRMYPLVVLLGMLATGAFVRGFVHGRRRFVIAFAVLVAAMLYTHNWAAFFALGSGVGIAAVALARRDWGVLRDGVLAGAGALLLYAPWIPSLLYQAEHTGAPWSTTPEAGVLDDVPNVLLGSDLVLAILGGASAIGYFLVVRRGPASERRAAAALALLLLTAVGAAFAAAQIEPGWATRYFAVFLAPLVLLVALGTARAPVVGVVALVAMAVISYKPVTPSPYFKSNAEATANQVNQHLRPGDVVLSTQPEQVPLLRHYMPPGLIWGDPRGLVENPRVMDWRDGLDALRAARPPEAIEPVLRSVRPGKRLVVVRPIVRSLFGWRAPWTRTVRYRSKAISAIVARDPRFRRIGRFKGQTQIRSRNVGVTAMLYERVRGRSSTGTPP